MLQGAPIIVHAHLAESLAHSAFGSASQLNSELTDSSL
jgi:hypothetical protein